MSRLRGVPLFGQIAVLLLLSVAVAQGLSLAVLFFSPPPPADLHRLTDIAAALKGAATNRLAVTNAAAPPFDDMEDPGERSYRLSLAQVAGVPPDAVRVLIRGGRDGPPPGPSVGRVGGPGPMMRPGDAPDVIASPFTAALRTAPGRWTLATPTRDLVFEAWRNRILLWFLASAAFVVVVAYAFARRLTAPIGAFADAADRLGRDPQAPAMAAEGPAELGAAARAFNRMQERLRRYVEDRTGLVAAIAHDLRTPLTRLAFRLEEAPEELRRKAGADIAEMQAMIGATLAFVRDSRHSARERIELSSLIESICTDAVDAGGDAVAEPSEPVVVEGDPLALRSLVTNLVTNAIKYGRRARARVRSDAAAILIEIDDDGPGLPAAEIERVFEPFYRVERSRSRDTGGAGLGLAIVRSVAHGHGGEVTLANRPEGGLRATVALPR